MTKMAERPKQEMDLQVLSGGRWVNISRSDFIALRGAFTYRSRWTLGRNDPYRNGGPWQVSRTVGDQPQIKEIKQC